MQRVLIILFVVATTFTYCRKESGQKISTSVNNSAQGDGPGTTPIYSYPFQFQAYVNLSIARGELSSTSLGNKVYFGGGRNYLGNGTSLYYSTVDIFDVTDLSRTTSQLSLPRYWLSSGTLGNKIFFAGGMGANGHSNRVDIYDAQTNTWSTAQLSQPRYLVTVTSTNTKIYFAGGITFNSQRSNVVDIYDGSTNSWSTSTVKTIEGDLVGASAGNTTIFAGIDYDGNQGSNTVIYNTIPFFQTVTPLAGHGVLYRSATSIGNKIMIAGGYNHPPSKKVSIYDVQSHSWSTHDLSEGRLGIGACRLDRFAVFAGGSLADDGASDRLDAYDNNSGTWHSMKLNNKWWPLAVTGAEKKLFIAMNASYLPTGVVAVYKLSNSLTLPHVLP